MHIGLKLKVARLSKGYSQQELADKIGKSRGLVSHIEQTGEVNHATFNAIARALGMAPESIEKMVNEPSAIYTSKEKAYDNLVKENEKLREENSMLKDLVQSQKETIALLKKAKSKKA